MQTKHFIILFVSAVLSGLSVISHATPTLDLRNTRHCEIILLKKKLNLSIYSTIGGAIKSAVN